MKLKNAAYLSLINLSAHKKRAVLTGIGIMVSVLFATMFLSTSNGNKILMEQSINNEEYNTVTVSNFLPTDNKTGEIIEIGDEIIEYLRIKAETSSMIVRYEYPTELPVFYDEGLEYEAPELNIIKMTVCDIPVRLLSERLVGVDTRFDIFSASDTNEIENGEDVIIAGRNFSGNDIKSCIVSEYFLHMFENKDPQQMIGQYIEIDYRDAENKANTIMVKIIGVYNSIIDINRRALSEEERDVIYDEDVKYMSKEYISFFTDSMVIYSDDCIRQLSEDTRQKTVGPSRISVAFDDIEKIEEVVQYLNKNYDHAVWAEIIEIKRAIEQKNEYNFMLLIFTMFISSSSVVILFNTMTMAVIERKKQIALMKCVGFSSNEILVSFLWEALIIGMISGIVAIVLSVGIGVITNIGMQATFDMPFSSTIDYFVLDVFVYILIFLMSSAITAFFGMLPAIKPSLEKPANAMRED